MNNKKNPHLGKKILYSLVIAMSVLVLLLNIAGIIGALAAVGATLGPLFGGLLTTYLTWRISFALEVLVVLVVVGFSRHLRDSDQRESMAGFDFTGAVLSALGFTFIVLGLLMVSSYGFFTARKDMLIGDTLVFPQGGLSPVVVFAAIGVGILVLFAFWESRLIRKGQEPLITPALLLLRSLRIGVIEMALLFLVQAVSNTQMIELTADLPADAQAEILNINAQARDTGLSAAMIMLGIFSLLALGVSHSAFRLPGPGLSPDPAVT